MSISREERKDLREFEKVNKIQMMCESISTKEGVYPQNFVSTLKGGLSIEEIHSHYREYIAKKKQDHTFHDLAEIICNRLRYEESFSRDTAAYILSYNFSSKEG